MGLLDFQLPTTTLYVIDFLLVGLMLYFLFTKLKFWGPQKRNGSCLEKPSNSKVATIDDLIAAVKEGKSPTVTGWVFSEEEAEKIKKEFESRKVHMDAYFTVFIKGRIRR